MIAALRRWLRGDTAADRRIAALESEIAALRMVEGTTRVLYLERLARCEGCATCNLEPQGFGLPDYEFGDTP